MVVVRGTGVGWSVDDWRGLGDQPRSDHAGGTSVVGHAGLDGVNPSVRPKGPSRDTLYVLLWSGSPLDEIKSG